MGNADSKVAAEAAPESAVHKPKIGGENVANEEKKEADNHVNSKSKRKATARTTKQKSGGRGHEGASTVHTGVAEEQVHVNMAMADLMAYLQVVANNSNHLPLSRRDDPELDRTVSTLTSEDYARKSAAFIPADVRVIGGTFSRYGRVWDLPTTEEYNACDGAHEPGRSYGGACANSMLKVLYDAANDTLDTSAQEAIASSLFDDDDDEGTDDGLSTMGKSFKSGFSLDNGMFTATTLTWVELLRKMKAEMKEIEYAQMPKITTTRKIDLNKPFSLLPENFDPSKNKKRALLIGCNYKNIPGAELKASHDDVRSMKDYIVNVHGFSESPDCMTVLIDDSEHKHPTFHNITEAFKSLSEQCQPGDAVFVQFSGHGGRILDSSSDEEAESYDEVIAPLDYQTSGLVRDTLIFKTLLAPMQYGVTLTVIIDTCDTGMLLELPYSWTTKKDRREGIAKLAVNDDFSFVRFLKVVKTLYESSTFTQLGKTVGSVLNVKEEDDGVREGDSYNRDYDEHSDKTRQESVFDAIAKACALSSKSSRDEMDGKGPGQGGIVKKRGKGRNDSLLEQVLNTCSVFTQPEGDDLTDEGHLTLQNSTDNFSEYDTATGKSSFDTLSEDEYEDRKRRTISKRR